MRGPSLRRGGPSFAAIAAISLATPLAMSAPTLVDGEGAPAVAPVTPSPWQKPFALEGHLGIGTPRGLMAVALDMTPMPWVSLNLGLGQGVHGIQYAAMARVRVAPAPVTWGVGAGVSAGRYAWDSDGCNVFTCYAPMERDSVYRQWNNAVWGNAEAYLEGRSTGGFQWRVYVGLGRLMNPGASTCSASAGLDAQSVERLGGCDSSITLGYFGSALGYAFSL